MKKLFLSTLLLTATSTLVAETQVQKPQTQQPSLDLYKAKDFSQLLGMPGFSDKMLNQHFTLYQGYVKNTNLLLGILQQYASEGADRTPQYGELKRRLGWEFDGMRLHEYYFSNLGGKGSQIDSKSPLSKQIAKDFGSFDAWKKDFIASGMIRGIGWVILYFDPFSNRLINIWIGEHDIGHLASSTPILIMDVWEHAYMPDYGINREDYIKAFFENIDWKVVESRYTPKNS